MGPWKKLFYAVMTSAHFLYRSILTHLFKHSLKLPSAASKAQSGFLDIANRMIRKHFHMAQYLLLSCCRGKFYIQTEVDFF